MKEYIYDSNKISNENDWELFFRSAVQGININSSSHLKLGKEEADYITFKDKDYEVGSFDHMIIFEDDKMIKGITKLDYPLIFNNYARFLVMSYNKSNKLFSRESYIIKGDYFYDYIYDKCELLTDCIRYTNSNKRNFKLENDLEKYVSFKKRSVLPEDPTSPSGK